MFPRMGYARNPIVVRCVATGRIANAMVSKVVGFNLVLDLNHKLEAAGNRQILVV